MANINTIISTRNFELIRDRIAQILAVELANQKSLTGDTLFDSTVWLERFIPFDQTEMPAINVYFSDASYDNLTPISSKGRNSFYIDVHMKDKHTAGIDGDKGAALKLHRLIGVIMAILEDPYYVMLDFSPGTIQHTEVSEIKIGQPTSQQDSTQLITGRITFVVNANENTRELSAIDADKYSTSVRLGETEKGFYYETINS